MPWYGNTARSFTTPRPDGVRAAPRIDHGIAQHRGARARSREHTAPVVRREDRVEQGGSLEHRPQVQRRAVGQVDELRRAHRGGDLRVLGLGAVQHRQRSHAWPRDRRSAPPARSPTRSGMLVRGGGREHDHLAGAAGLEQLGVERTAARAATRRLRRGRGDRSCGGDPWRRTLLRPHGRRPEATAEVTGW